MTWVVTRLCRDCLDLSCVDVCPVDCIFEYQGSGATEMPNRLFIDPTECIDCGVCTPACPWEAAVEDVDVPAAFAGDIELNARISELKHHRRVPDVEKQSVPSPREVESNKKRWERDAR